MEALFVIISLSVTVAANLSVSMFWCQSVTASQSVTDSSLPLAYIDNILVQL